MDIIQYQLWPKQMPKKHETPKMGVAEVNRIASLYQLTEKEHQFAILAYPLLHGREVKGQWLQIAKLNNPANKDDEAIYRPDFGVLANGKTIGYLDIELKPSWHKESWPYPTTNIAKEPMSHWEDNRFNGRLTNKLIAFQQKPDMSFWVGVRKDWAACWIIHAVDIFAHGEDGLQPTSYSTIPLPVIHVSNTYGVFCDNAEALASYIMSVFEAVTT